MELEAIYAVNFPGRFIAKTGIAKTVHLFQLTARYFI
jgi:hypothetical protein